MADWDAIAAQAKAAREIQCNAGGHTFTLRIPTRHECLQIAYKCGAADDNQALLQRALIEAAVVGWAGPSLRDLVPGEASTEPIEWAPQGVPLLLDAQPAWEDALNQALVRALNERYARARDTAGN